MEDIDTRLEVERPEVADALRSMNWEERLEQARARRKAVLARNEAAEKRPVVRIINADVMARRRAEAEAPQAADVVAFPAARPVAEPPRETEVVAAAPAAAQEEAAPVLRAGRSSLVARTAMGFGLGLGLGTSLLAGAWMLLVRPSDAPVTQPPATTAIATPVPARPEPAPAEPPTGVVTVAQPPATTAPATPVAAQPEPALAEPSAGAAPVVASVSPSAATDVPTGAGLPNMPAEADAVLPAAIAGGPGRSTRPALPMAAPADAFVRPDALPQISFAVLPAAFPAVSAEAATFRLPVPAPGQAPAGGPPARITQDAPEAPPFAAGQPIPPLAVAYGAPSALPLAAPEVATLRVPGAFAALRPVAFPALPGGEPGADAPPVASFAPPAPPAAAEPAIPGADTLFVRLAVPQTVPDAEAEEVAGLLREIGIGGSRVTRVGFKVSESHVRYYRPEDAAAAAALAEMIGTEARDHTTFRPRPPDGTLEIFLAGERTAPPARAAAPNRARQQPPDDLTRMRDRIVNRLRRGEHL